MDVLTTETFQYSNCSASAIMNLGMVTVVQIGCFKAVREI